MFMLARKGEDGNLELDGKGLEALLEQAAQCGKRRGPPLRVCMAYEFIKHCNRQMGYRAFYGGSAGTPEVKVRKAELATQQEKVFNLACHLLGEYFADGIAGDCFPEEDLPEQE